MTESLALPAISLEVHDSTTTTSTITPLASDLTSAQDCVPQKEENLLHSMDDGMSDFGSKSDIGSIDPTYFLHVPYPFDPSRSRSNSSAKSISSTFSLMWSDSRFSDVKFQAYLEQLEREHNVQTPRIPSQFTVPETLKVRARITPHKIAYSHLDNQGQVVSRISYIHLHTRATALARLLTEKNAGGHSAVVALEHGIDYVVALVGCLYAQVIPVPVPALTLGSVVQASRALDSLLTHTAASMAIAPWHITATIKLLSNVLQTPNLSKLEWISLPSPPTTEQESDFSHSWGEGPQEALAILDCPPQLYENGASCFAWRPITHKDMSEIARSLRKNIKQPLPPVPIPSMDDKRMLDTVFLPILLGCEGMFVVSGLQDMPKKSQSKFSRSCFAFS